MLRKWSEPRLWLFAVVFGLATAGVHAKEEGENIEVLPYLITVGDPLDPKYANAGEN